MFGYVVFMFSFDEAKMKYSYEMSKLCEATFGCRSQSRLTPLSKDYTFMGLIKKCAIDVHLN